MTIGSPSISRVGQKHFSFSGLKHWLWGRILKVRRDQIINQEHLPQGWPILRRGCLLVPAEGGPGVERRGSQGGLISTLSPWWWE